MSLDQEARLEIREMIQQALKDQRVEYRTEYGDRVFAEVSHENAETVFKAENTVDEPSLVEAGLDDAMSLIKGFHETQQVSPVQRLIQLDRGVSETMDLAAATLSTLAEQLLHVSHEGDQTLCRAHLLCEELGELLAALSARDEVKALDALADLLYVTLGTAVTLDLPLPAAFVEVHRSNMTKERQVDDPEGHRVREKGPNYSPPDLDKLMYVYRKATFGSHCMVTHAGGGKDCLNCGMSIEQVFKQIDETGRACCKGQATILNQSKTTSRSSSVVPNPGHSQSDNAGEEFGSDEEL